MADPLEKYRKKRDPGGTNEPFSAEHSVRDLGPAWGGRFVIHQHAASRMHYDLRLEINGSLQSFAIPKGVHQNPEEKHLAVHTEEHPLEYLFFEDVIPEGNYGAGSMIIWDTGRFSLIEADGTDSLARGKLDFVLDGFKAKGRYALIATGRRKAAKGLAGTSGLAAEWLFIKKKDRHADAERDLVSEFPRSVLSGLTVNELKDKARIGSALAERARVLAEQYPATAGLELTCPLVPMVVPNGDAPKTSSKHLYELKLDGVRVVAHKRGQDVTLQYRSGRICTRNYAEAARCVQHLPLDVAILDGEIITFDEQGHPNFGRLAPRIQAQRASDIVQAQTEVPVVYFAFDLLSAGGHILVNVPLEKRKQLLFELVRGQGHVRALDHIVERGDALWALCEEQRTEGMVAKKRSSPYVLGPDASDDWVKIKRKSDEDFVVVGFSLGERGEFKALLVALYEGEKLRYMGRVGTGFKNKDRLSLTRMLNAMTQPSPAAEIPASIRASFVKPELVVKVRYQGLSNAGHLRAASFQGIHESKDPRDCKFGGSSMLDQVEAEEFLLERSDASRQSPPVDTGVDVLADTRAQLTNLEKIYFPDDGYTKGDLVRYYAQVAPFMLPHLCGRPVVLVRYPDGISGKNFYQWRAPESTPAWIRTFELYDEEKQQERGSNKSAFLIDSTDALLHIANLGCIPLHVLASRERSSDECDFLTIDFDLGERPLADGVRLALTLKEFLDELGLAGFPKTSGQRGLHVLIPLGPKVKFPSAKLLCELLGRIVLSRHSDISTMQRRIDKRGDKVYIDTGQTGRSRTIVAPYSVRAYPGARVSTPLSWNEIHLALDPSVFNIETVPGRLAQLGDPMLTLLESRPAISEVIEQLARWTSSF